MKLNVNKAGVQIRTIGLNGGHGEFPIWGRGRPFRINSPRRMIRKARAWEQRGEIVT